MATQPLSASLAPQPSTWLQRHEVWILLGGIVASSALFSAGIAYGLIPQKLYNFGRFALLGLVLGTVVLASRGPRALWDVIASLAVWRVKPRWYLLAAGWALGIGVLTLVVRAWVTGRAWPELPLQLGFLQNRGLLLTIFISSLIGEIVWVSYAIDRLRAKGFAVYPASLIVGVFWTLWWMPMMMLNAGVIPHLPPVWLLVNMLGVAAMCGFMQAQTGSALIVLLLQIMVNTTLLLLPVTPGDSDVPTYATYALVYFCAAALMHLLFGSRRRAAGSDEARAS